MDTPVALLIFNRPQTTEKVFREIAGAKPSKLLVIADGPRADKPDDIEKCAAARSIVEQVDWECEVIKNYSESNLGCGWRPHTGISWVFEQVNEAIILEDDCLPHPTFFRFCEELLRRYRDDERVMMISGNNFLFDHQKAPYSYYFNRNVGLWGWATWRRAWKHMDMKIKLWKELRDTLWLEDISSNSRAVEYWWKIFDRTYERTDNIDHWDYQWTFALWSQNALAASPNVNLVSNIGFGPDATHTRSTTNRLARFPTTEMVFPLQHPPYLIRDRQADQLIFDQAFSPPISRHPRYRRLFRKARNYMSALRRKLV